MRFQLDPLSPTGVSIAQPEPKAVRQSHGYVAKVQTLNELTDVTIESTPNDNQALAYDTATGKWIPQTIAGGGGGGTTEWGLIEGTLSAQTDLQTALGGKADTTYVDAQDAEVAADASTALSAHTARLDNPHSVTKSQVGLGNVDNTSDANKPVSTAQAAADALKVSKAGDTMTGRLDFPAENFTIYNPPIRFTAPDTNDGEDSKGNIIEWGTKMTGGDVLPYGVATKAYRDWLAGGSVGSRPTFTVPGSAGVQTYRKNAWFLSHYDSPASTGEDVHQHSNWETVMADMVTVITRIQVSWGEDVALVSFPNSEVKFYADKDIQIGTDASGARIKHDTALARITVSGNLPWNFSGTGGLRVGSAGAPGGRIHSERSDDGTAFYAKNTAAGGTATAQHLIEAVTSGSTSIATKVTGESVNRFSMNHSGRMEWGSGSATRDTNLYRNAANELKTDDKLVAALGLNNGAASTPASATATGTAGDICWDANYVYVCVATNTWKRSALSTW